MSLIPFCPAAQIPEQELGIMTISFLSFSCFFSFTVKNHGPPQVVHWTHRLLGQGCGFLSHICVDARCSVDMSENKSDDGVEHRVRALIGNLNRVGVTVENVSR